MKFTFALLFLLTATAALAESYSCNYKIMMSGQGTLTTTGKDTVIVNGGEQMILANKEGSRNPDDKVLNNVAGSFKLLDDGVELKLVAEFYQYYTPGDDIRLILGRVWARGDSKSNKIYVDTYFGDRRLSVGCTRD